MHSPAQPSIDDLLLHLDNEEYVADFCEKYHDQYFLELVDYLGDTESDENATKKNIGKRHCDYVYTVSTMFKQGKYNDAIEYYRIHELSKESDIFDYELLTYTILPICLNNIDVVTINNYYEVMDKKTRHVNLVLAFMANIDNWLTSKIIYKKYDDYPHEIMNWFSTLGSIRNIFIKEYIRNGFNLSDINDLKKRFKIFDEYMCRYPAYN